MTAVHYIIAVHTCSAVCIFHTEIDIALNRWQNKASGTVDPLRIQGAKAIRLSDPQFLPTEYPQFSHCRGVTLGRVLAQILADFSEVHM